MGGGTRQWGHDLTTSVKQGLSPRGRGNLLCRSGQQSTQARVYPRVGGGTATACTQVRWLPICGLSPRGRGNHRAMSIRTCILKDTVYPRVGGGTQSGQPLPGNAGSRSIPAWAGEPHGRDSVAVYPGLRSIPAWAGEPISAPDAGPRYEEDGLIPAWAGEPGKSVLRPVCWGCGLIPAWAGEPVKLPADGQYCRLRSIPAWAGEPHLSGKYRHPSPGPTRSIPAWAGEPSRRLRRPLRIPESVYPRVGGGTWNWTSGQTWAESPGLSPRGRGNLRLPCLTGHGLAGSIPAWAGEPRDQRPGR